MDLFFFWQWVFHWRSGSFWLDDRVFFLRRQRHLFFEHLALDGLRTRVRCTEVEAKVVRLLGIRLFLRSDVLLCHIEIESIEVLILLDLSTEHFFVLKVFEIVGILAEVGVECARLEVLSRAG